MHFGSQGKPFAAQGEPALTTEEEGGFHGYEHTGGLAAGGAGIGAGDSGGGRGEEEAAWKARRGISHRGKTLRAFEAYLDLLDTTAYLQSELSSQLAAYDVTLGGLRVLDMGYRRGPTAPRGGANKLRV